ncbi:class I histocompatibility antigen, F10 alpha chain-like isoform X2 [Colossoma macropomum]|uniref:class I histocompatibility antigen, F10 alpha chain-like isoform X2 n=1 Tax=Colossoma macropomum TaxID=42526 RepID=UPI001864B982|nr:class I histocompatibility antigen, F10 alpha chain-like isoform X2 [Colossoma macropomum]
MGAPAVCVVFLSGVVVSVLGDKHSLYYIYSALNKDVALPGIYEFTALGLLDDREIDYYNSKEQVKVPKQDWMKEKMQSDYWDKGTQSRKSKEQWFKVNVDILMQRMRHPNNTDLHVLQWRHGCEIDESNGQVTFLKGIDEYSYDGKEFLSFDDDNMRWIAPVPEALPTKRKWDEVPILNQYTKGYLEKECVDWLTKFMEYRKESLRKHSKPDVHAFAKKSTTNSGKLTLTCLATGFYPKDVKMSVRKFRTSPPEHLLKSSGVRPNEDGTYQLRKSMDIKVDETAEYDCFVNHSSFAQPVITIWDKRCFDCESSGSGTVGGVICGVVVLLLILGGIIFTLIKKRIIGIPGAVNAAPALQAPPNGVPEPLLPADRKAGGSDSGSDSGKETGSTNSSNENGEGGTSDSGQGTGSTSSSNENGEGGSSDSGNSRR